MWKKQALLFQQCFLMVGDYTHQRQSQPHPTSQSDHFLQSYVQMIFYFIKINKGGNSSFGIIDIKTGMAETKSDGFIV